VTVEHLDLQLVNAATPSRLAGTLLVNGNIDKRGTVVGIDVKSLDGTFKQWPLATRGALFWRNTRWEFEPLTLRIGANEIVVNGNLASEWDAGAQMKLNDLRTLQSSFAGRASGNATISGAPTDPRFDLLLAAEDLLLPAVTLPAPVDRTVRLPAADWLIAGTASLGDIHLDDAHTQEGQAFSLAARGDVAWRGPLRWTIETDIAALSLQDLLPELLGDVAGTFATRGVLTTQLDSLAIETTLDGESLGLPLSVSTAFDYAPTHTRVRNLRVQHGSNRVLASGALDKAGSDDGTIALDLDVAAPDIGSSLRDLGGSASIRASIAGLQNRPDLRASVLLDAITWQHWRVGRLSIDSDIRDGFFAPSSLRIGAQDITQDVPGQAGQSLQSVSLRADGTRDAHTLDIAAQAAPAALRTTLSGTLRGTRRDDIDWQGRLDSGELDLNEWRWESTGAPQIRYRHDSASVAPHCWSDGAARACLSTTAELGNSGRLDAELFHLPFDRLLGDLMPIDTRVDGKVGGLLSLAWENRNLTALRTDIRNENTIRLALTDDLEKRTLGEISEFTVDASLSAGSGHLHARAHGAQVGTLLAEAQLGAGSAGGIGQRPLTARIEASDIQVGLLEAFTYQLRDVGGTLGGVVNLQGTPEKPAISGRVDLVNGRTGFTRLPVNLGDINVTSKFDGTQATFNGTFRTAESTGSGRIDGELGLVGKHWQGSGTLTGDGLVFASQPEYQFTTAPDLALSVDAGHIGINGNVKVAAGKIELKSLPAQSVRRSRDVVLVREEEVISDAGIGFRQNVDVDFVLGEEVYFRAFGGNGRLTGDLRVRSTPELPLLVNGELHVHDGKYSAFGQALTLKQADIIFNGPADQPLIDALASRSFDDSAVREVGLRLSGSLRAPQTTLWSAPTMPDEEALSWLATGRPLSDGPINLRGEAAQAALSLGVAQGSALLTAAGQEIGLQDIQLATIGDGDDAEVQVGTNVNEKIFVGYNRRVFTGSESVLLRLHLTRRLMLEALSGIESALDIFYTFEF
jgi:translocation and assembly module TamB